MSWTHTMLEGLLEARAGGEVEFGRAWRHAERRAKARGVTRPRDYLGAGPEDDPEWLPFSSFFRRACCAEWEGRVGADYLGLRELIEGRAEDGPPPGRTVLLA